MDLYECIDLQRGPRLNLIQWLQQRSLMANPLRCAQCNHDMELKQRNDNHIDGFHWWVKIRFEFPSEQTIPWLLTNSHCWNIWWPRHKTERITFYLAIIESFLWQGMTSNPLTDIPANNGLIISQLACMVFFSLTNRNICIFNPWSRLDIWQANKSPQPFKYAFKLYRS